MADDAVETPEKITVAYWYADADKTFVEEFRNVLRFHVLANGALAFWAVNSELSDEFPDLIIAAGDWRELTFAVE